LENNFAFHGLRDRHGRLNLSITEFQLTQTKKQHPNKKFEN